MSTQSTDLAIIGFGPAGLATAVSYLETSDGNITAFDPSENIGSGSLEGIDIESNSNGDDFVSQYPFDHPKIKLEDEHKKHLCGVNKPVHLSRAAGFLKSTAQELVNSTQVRLVKEHADSIYAQKNGFEICSQNSRTQANRLVVAIGGSEVLLPPLAKRDRAKTFTSREILANERTGDLDDGIKFNSKVIIVGNSHGAYSVAERILERYPKANIIFSKLQPTKAYFKNEEEAYRFGYAVTDKDEICIETGAINRFTGIRGKARELWFSEQQQNLWARVSSVYDLNLDRLDRNCVVIQATGYQQRPLNLRSEDNQPISYSTRPHNQDYALIYDQNNIPIARCGAIGISFSRHDGTAVYQQQARALLRALK